jgi:hypothetical protein
MSQSPVEVLGDLYTASGRGDIPSVLATVGDDIDRNAPENLPRGGRFHGRDVRDGGRFASTSTSMLPSRYRQRSVRPADIVSDRQEEMK